MNDISTLHSFRCELNSGPCEAELHKALMHQDALADTFRVAVCRDMKPVDLTGMAVFGYLYCPATRQTLPLDGTAEGHYASVTLTDACYAQPGWYSLVIQLQHRDVRHTVLKVDFAIQRTGSESLIVPGEATSLAELIARIEALEKGGGGSGGTGADGFSPVANVQQTDDGAVVTITDKEGTTTATVSNGVSPTVAVSRSGKVTTLTITDATGTKTATINDGADGTGDGSAAVPDYVTAEAEAVIDRVIAAQGTRTFTFAAMTDMHYGNSGYTDGIKHACQALKYIDERVKLDAVAVLGDYTDGYPSTTLTDAMADYRAANALLDTLRFAPNLRQMGNHDYYPDNIPVTRRLIQSYSDNVVWGDRQGGYYYRDFDDYKLRIIVPNCNECNVMGTDNKPSSGTSITDAQGQWFADTLADLNAKSDADEWQALVLSHQPLDFWDQTGYHLAHIAYAYGEGKVYSSGAVSCDFSGGRNKAVFVGNIHGHIHNLLVGNIHDGHAKESSASVSSLYRMSTPNACYGRENQYDEVWLESTTYSKTQNSAKDTAFVVYCIDLDNRIINAVCYGAGYDRTIVYSGDAVMFSVTTYMPNVSSSNGATSVISGGTYTTTLTANAGYTLGTVTVLMGGTDITATAYANGKITIAAVTGDVNIVAEAVADGGGDSGEITNWVYNGIDTSGAIYNGKGYKEGYRISTGSGNESSATGMSVTGFIPVHVKDIPGGCTIRIKDIDLTSGDSTLGWYASDFSHLAGGYCNSMFGAADANGVRSYTSTSGDRAYIRISGAFGSNPIITVDEEIQ